MSTSSPRMFATIHLGSEQVNLNIVQYTTMEDRQIIERAGREVFLGEETFKTGRISYETVGELCELLKGYRRMLREYGVKEFRVIATTALREAENQHYIIDQIRIRTGFEVEVVDMLTEIYFKYVALFKALEDKKLTQSDKAILFVDISSGGLGFTLYRNGGIQYQQNVHIGALRIKESFNKNQRESAHFQQALAEYIISSIEVVREALKQEEIEYLVTSGNDSRLLLQMMGFSVREQMTFVTREAFNALHENVRELNLPQLMQRFNLPEYRAEMVLPVIVLYKQILDATNAGELAFPDVHLVDGVNIMHIAEKTKDPLTRALEEQIVILMRSIGSKYQYDPHHAKAVEDISLLLFDRTASVHGLSSRVRLMLKVACILHDIGKFVNLRRHYFYSYRLILSSDILGFTEREKEVIANVSYYHSKGIPSSSHQNFQSLSTSDKITSAKLAALIRLADAIDRSHRQKAKLSDIRLNGTQLEVIITADEDYSLEEWTFEDKADFFEEVHGIRPLLIRQVG